MTASLSAWAMTAAFPVGGGVGPACWGERAPDARRPPGPKFDGFPVHDLAFAGARRRGFVVLPERPVGHGRVGLAERFRVERGELCHRFPARPPPGQNYFVAFVYAFPSQFPHPLPTPGERSRFFI